MEKVKVSERMAMARAEVAEKVLGVLGDAAKIAVGTYVVETEHGFVKVALTAVKDVDFDVAEAVEAYQFQLAEAKVRAEKAAAKKAETAAKKAEKAKAQA